jgi:S1-C subfamily serine protease
MDGLNRKYVATLALVAFSILVVGLLIKPQDGVEAPVPVAEAAPLQQLSRERDLRAQASYFAERIAAVAPQTVYLSEFGISAVRWDSAAMVATTLPDVPITTIRYVQSDDTVRSALPVPPTERVRWVLAVARRPDGSTVSAVGLNGGLATAQCGDATYRELILDVPLHSALAGGGLFDLSGRRLGLIVLCDGRTAAIPVGEVERALRELASVRGRLKGDLGLAVAALDQRLSAYFRRDTGVVVVELQQDSPADSWDLRPGDIIESIDNQPVRNVDDLAPLLVDSSLEHTIGRVRDGRRAQLRVSRDKSPASAENELGTSAGWTIITSIRPGTVVYRAGLRPGDRVLQVDDITRPSVTALRQAVARADTTEVFLVFQRGTLQRAVLTSPR